MQQNADQENSVHFNMEVYSTGKLTNLPFKDVSSQIINSKCVSIHVLKNMYVDLWVPKNIYLV